MVEYLDENPQFKSAIEQLREKNVMCDYTILALKEGIKTGADWLEIDVHKTKDNKLVVIHDEDIENTFKEMI